MVLRLAILLLVGACSQSLFANGGDKDGGTGGEQTVANMCDAPCVGDAAADFGDPKWRYLEDNKNRTWTPMTQAGMTYTGAGANKIAKCEGSAAACTTLPGALLVSTGGAADPAVELKLPMNQVVKVSVKVAVPAGAAAQTVRLYRNSREDSLVTGDAQPGATYEASVTIDGLQNDRILVSIGGATGAENVGLHIFVSGTGATFPANCQIALNFASTTLDNLCGGDFTSENYTTSTPEPVVLGTGPFPEQGQGAELALDKYYKGTNLLVKTSDTTTQFWVRYDGPVGGGDAWVFSDLDLNDAGGIGIVIFENGGRMMEVTTCTNGNPLEFKGDMTPYPTDSAWHFVRVVQKGALVNVCLDGAKKFTFAAPAGSLESTFRPHMGRNVVWTPAGAFTKGGLDDVRVLNGALPCD